MLNYISAEFYKLRRKKGLWLGMALLLLLETVTLTPGFMLEQLRVQDAYLAFLSAAAPVGLFLAPIFAVLAFDDQYALGTLKNEIVYGVPRRRIYLGKLLSAALMGTLCALLAVGWYLAGMLLVSRNGIGASPLMWRAAGVTLLVSYLVWLAALGFTLCLLFVMRSSLGAVLPVYLLTIMGTPLALAGYGEGGDVSNWDFLYWFSRLYYAAPYRVLLNGEGHPILYGAAICLGWVAVTALLGLAVFRRREIK